MKYTYRNIEFQQLNKNVWKFDSFLPPPASRWGYWCRFFTKEEINNTTLDAMTKAIDRAYDDAPIYTGNIRGMLE